ncbi:beta-ketoacyl-ACP synthase I [candidate division KSB1 bacterium]|nr:beta-ketoacyl-ACP synthase I [candidate division KSB1 bacterium]
MRRVVITGMGAASSLGLDIKVISTTLRSGKSCIIYNPHYEEHGFTSLVSGWIPDWDAKQFFDRKALKTMGPGSEFTSYAALRAMEDSGLPENEVQSDRCGVIVGCGEGSAQDMFEAAQSMIEHNRPRRIGIRVPKTMGSSRSANITLLLKNRGVSFGISAACATGLVNIGYAYQMVKWGIQDIVFAGGGESADWCGSSFFDAMGVLPSKYNDNPSASSRPFDKNRDGFVMAEGGGVVVVEDLARAKSRGAKIYGEIVGYASNCDGGLSMVLPSPDGQSRCMQAALNDAGLKAKEIDYINTHGTSTVAGDPSEIKAVQEVFGDHAPMLSSTKSQIGHAIGAAGALEFIAAVLMLNESFIAPSINIDELDEACAYTNIITETKNVEFDSFLTNNFAFGGSNASMIVKKYRG